MKCREPCTAGLFIFILIKETLDVWGNLFSTERDLPLWEAQGSGVFCGERYRDWLWCLGTGYATHILTSLGFPKKILHPVCSLKENFTFKFLWLESQEIYPWGSLQKGDTNGRLHIKKWLVPMDSSLSCILNPREESGTHFSSIISSVLQMSLGQGIIPEHHSRREPQILSIAMLSTSRQSVIQKFPKVKKMNWWLLWFISRSSPCTPKPHASKAGVWGRWVDFRVCSWLAVRRWSHTGGGKSLWVRSGRIYLPSQLLPWWLRLLPFLCPSAMLLDKTNLPPLSFQHQEFCPSYEESHYDSSRVSLSVRASRPCLHVSVFLHRPQNLIQWHSFWS